MMNTMLHRVPALMLAVGMLAQVVAQEPATDKDSTAAPPAARVDQYGDELPDRVLARMGTMRWRQSE